MKNEKQSNKMPYNPTPSCEPIFGQPESCFDMINKYGTYNIQPTADTSNEFPAISHGLPKKEKKAQGAKRI